MNPSDALFTGCLSKDAAPAKRALTAPEPHQTPFSNKRLKFTTDTFYTLVKAATAEWEKVSEALPLVSEDKRAGAEAACAQVSQLLQQVTSAAHLADSVTESQLLSDENMKRKGVTKAFDAFGLVVPSRIQQISTDNMFLHLSKDTLEREITMTFDRAAAFLHLFFKQADDHPWSLAPSQMPILGLDGGVKKHRACLHDLILRLIGSCALRTDSFNIPWGKRPDERLRILVNTVFSTLDTYWKSACGTTPTLAKIDAFMMRAHAFLSDHQDICRLADAQLVLIPTPALTAVLPISCCAHQAAQQLVREQLPHDSDRDEITRAIVALATLVLADQLRPKSASSITMNVQSKHIIDHLEGRDDNWRYIYDKIASNAIPAAVLQRFLSDSGLPQTNRRSRKSDSKLSKFVSRAERQLISKIGLRVLVDATDTKPGKFASDMDVLLLEKLEALKEDMSRSAKRKTMSATKGTNTRKARAAKGKSRVATTTDTDESQEEEPDDVINNSEVSTDAGPSRKTGRQRKGLKSNLKETSDDESFP